MKIWKKFHSKFTPEKKILTQLIIIMDQGIHFFHWKNSNKTNRQPEFIHTLNFYWSLMRSNFHYVWDQSIYWWWQQKKLWISFLCYYYPEFLYFLFLNLSICNVINDDHDHDLCEVKVYWPQYFFFIHV